MGAYLSSPVKTKETESNENDQLRVGATTMQGWRMQQEDAHNCILDYDENCSLFAVYDGHGGHEVSKFASNAFPEFLKATDMWRKGRIGEALEQSFLAFDEELTKSEVVEQLKLIAGTKSENEAEDDEDKELLYEEARLPLEEVLSKYGIKLRFERDPDIDCNDPKHPKPLSPFRLTACPTKNRRPKICVAKLTGGQGKPCQEPNSGKESGLESPPSSPIGEKADIETDKCASVEDDDVAAADIHSSPECEKTNTTAACLKRDSNGKLKFKVDKQQKQRNQKNHLSKESSDGLHVSNYCTITESDSAEHNLPAIDVSSKRCKTCNCCISQNTASSQNAAAAVADDYLSTNVDDDVIFVKFDSIADNNDVFIDNDDVISKNANQQCRCNRYDTSTPEMTNGHKDAGYEEECDDHLPEPVHLTDMPKDEEVQKKLSSIIKNHSSDDSLKENAPDASAPEDSLSILPSLDGEKVQKVADTKIENIHDSEHAFVETPELGDVKDFVTPAITAASTTFKSASNEPVSVADTEGISEFKAVDVNSRVGDVEDEEAEDEEDEEYMAESGDDASSGDAEDDGSPDDDVVDENESDDDEIDPDSYPMPTCDTPGVSSGTTACVAVIKGDVLYVANAGDSRCVLCRGDRAVDLSEDHKPETSTEKERIERAGGKITEDGRVNGGLNLSRAIGDHFYKTNVNLPLKDQMISALPDVRVETLSADDKFMVLACDGIWNSMSSQAVVDFVSPRLAKGIEPSKICDEICDGCLAENTVGDGTGCDNMTIIIVDFKRTPPTATTPSVAVIAGATAQLNGNDITVTKELEEKTAVVLSKSEPASTAAEI